MQSNNNAKQIEREMQAALDIAWNSADSVITAKQRQLFPNGKPSVEEFLRVMSDLSPSQY